MAARGGARAGQPDRGQKKARLNALSDCLPRAKAAAQLDI
jgi:hypothetical protein